MVEPFPRPTTRPEPSLLERIANELKWKISGEVRFDDRARALYATDASLYEIKPHGVVLPKTIEDVKAVVEVANTHNLALLPRGGGTSLAGQAVGEAIVIDFTKYMDKVLEFNLEERWAKVQPGVIRDNLNEFLKPHKLQFTPDVSTTNRSAIGGMVANNSAGTRSIKYGKAVDQVIAMTVMLSDGSIAELKALSDAELYHKRELDTLEGKIYKTVHHVVTEHAAEIDKRFPKVMRRVGGYNLDELVGQPFNLAKLVSGSEGTLAIILDITIRLFPVPSHKCMALLHFDSLSDSFKAVPYINEHGPSAVETLDDVLLELGSQNPALAALMTWVRGNPKSVLIVEFDGESEAEMLRGLQSLQSDARIGAMSYYTHLAMTAKEQAEILELRKAGLGIYNTIKGDAKPVAFIEDAAIPPEHLADYIPEVVELCNKYNVKTVMYGHASVGVIHVRPILDMKKAEDLEKFKHISEETFALVKKYGGSWSGEHGDGLVRSYQNKKLFGDTLYNAFRDIKYAFDPKNLMNPGKIVDAQEDITENLRFHKNYQGLPLNTVFDFSGDGGFLGAVEMCSGVGACRKTTTGTMCPSYMATRDEDHSTRGRANILREAVTGKLPGGLTSKEVYNVLDLCLECKACKSECPSRVDMAKLKYEFLQQYYDVHGTPLQAKAFAYSYLTSPLGRTFAPIANKILPLKPVRWLLERTLGIDKRRIMPRYAEQSFEQWLREHKKESEHQKSVTANASKPKVALFADTWTMYHEANVGISATKVLEALGYQVEHIPYQCCGRTLISKGLLREAKKLAQKNVRVLQGYVNHNIPVVGLEPSCVTAFQDDYRDLVPGEKTEAVANHVKMIDQFLAKEWTAGKLEPTNVFNKHAVTVMLHGHCQQRAIMGTKATQAVLGWVSQEVKEVDSGCCGMAGSFGYSHYDVSMQSGERRLFPAARAHVGEIAACGFSCRHQIADGTNKHAKHVVEIMSEALKG
ncbi:MAG: FAD-binding and (Fe-S)-binding domain-containing protein [Trueperaceae bacterium]